MPAQDGLSSSDLKNGDTVLVKFGTKSKKLFNGTVELNFEPNEKDMGQVTPSKRAKLSPVSADDKKSRPKSPKRKSPGRKERQDDKS